MSKQKTVTALQRRQTKQLSFLDTDCLVVGVKEGQFSAFGRKVPCETTVKPFDYTSLQEQLNVFSQIDVLLAFPVGLEPARHMYIASQKGNA